MGWPDRVAGLFLAAVSCAESPRAGTERDIPEAVSTEVCGVLVGGASSGKAEVVAVGDEAPCTIEFREVTGLRSQSGGIAARRPVTAGPGGTYLTGTYQPGLVAVWSPEGELIRVMGSGRGEGPGEFGNVASMIVGSDSVVNILPGLPHWHRYTWGGDFLETVRTNSIGGLSEAAIGPDGVLVAKTQGPEGARLVLWRPGSEVRIVDGSFGADGVSWALISASPRMGLWSAVHSRYTIRRHALPEGAVDFEIHRRVEWFRSNDRENEESPPIVFGLTVDDRGLLWVWTNVLDPEAPTTPRPRADSPEDVNPEIANQYRDYVLEVFGMDGTLIASRRFDRAQDVAVGVAAGVWVRTEDDLLRSLTIVEPILESR